MEKISITIQVNRIPKDKITERRFFDKQNHEVSVKELKLDVVPLKEIKTIKEGDDWTMIKTHFVAIPQTKEEREQNQKSLIIGDGIIFKKKEIPQTTDEELIENGINPDDVPF